MYRLLFHALAEVHLFSVVTTGSELTHPQYFLDADLAGFFDEECCMTSCTRGSESCKRGRQSELFYVKRKDEMTVLQTGSCMRVPLL